MAAGIVARFGVVANVGVGVHPLRVVLHVIRTHILPGERIVIAEVVVQETGLAIEPLARLAIGGGHRSPTVVHRAIGAVVLQRDHLPIVVERHAVAAQGITDQVVQP